MLKFLACLLVWISIFSVFSGSAAAQTAGRESASPLLTAQITSQPKVPSGPLPTTKLPPDAVRPLKDIQPNITVTNPSAGYTARHLCIGKDHITIRWEYSGDIGCTVNIKAVRYTGDPSPRTIATRVQVQGGTGSYLWNLPADCVQGKGGGCTVTIIVEAGNGSTQGVGGIVEASGPDSRECTNDK